MQSSSPVIAVYFTAPGETGYPFNVPDYVEAYHEFAKVIESLGGTLAIVRSMTSFRGGSRFEGGWIFDGKTFQRTDDVIDANVVFNKGDDFVGDTETNVVNDPALHALCNKDETYRRFTEFSPRSFVVTSKQEYVQALQAIKADPVVIKPTDGEGGAGIFIGARKDANMNDRKFPLIVQEFIDTSRGIPGLVEGRHDLRLAFVGGQFAYAMIRMPPAGGMLSNLALGGSYIIIEQDQIPKKAMDMAHAIDRRLEMFPFRVYSADVGLNIDGRWMLFELNSPPGLRPAHGSPIIERYHRMLGEVLFFAAATSCRS